MPLGPTPSCRGGREAAKVDAPFSVVVRALACDVAGQGEEGGEEEAPCQEGGEVGEGDGTADGAEQPACCIPVAAHGRVSVSPKAPGEG